MRADSLTDLETFKLGKSSLGTIYFSYGFSDDPEFLILDEDSAHFYSERFTKNKALKSAKGTELRVLNDSTLEFCGIANSFTNHARRFRIRNDSLVLLGVSLVDSNTLRLTKVTLHLFKDSLFIMPACTISKGERVQVLRSQIDRSERFYDEIGVFFIKSKSCSGWYYLNPNGKVYPYEPIQELYFHGD